LKSTKDGELISDNYCLVSADLRELQVVKNKERERERETKRERERKQTR